MVKLVVSLLSIVLLCIPTAKGRKTLYPSVDSDSGGVCKSFVFGQGYKCEEHKVTTQDGFILSLQRMPVGRSGKMADKPPVLLHHGLFCDASTWLINLPDESLPFILADNGFDVWLANGRGTEYSSGHTSLSPDDMAYWDWSWDELASYDLSASVQYVYQQTRQKMHYVGHSQGTLIALAALSQNQLLNMLRSAALLCPIAHMKEITSPPAKFTADAFQANKLYWLGLREFIPNGIAASKLLENMCHALNLKCKDLITTFTGPNCCINSSRFDIFLDHGLQPTATKELIHQSQMVRTGIIAKYDYGDPVQNLQHYRQLSPPLYDMASIPSNFPLFLAYGGQDALSDVGDVQVLLNDLSNHDRNKLMVVFREDYAHMDFVLGVNAKQIVYDPMMAFFSAN